jgi:DNA-binding NarL/FixJ family response regulator
VFDADPRRARRLASLLRASGISTAKGEDGAGILVLGFDSFGRAERDSVTGHRREAPEAPLVVVVATAGPRTARDALAAGADALVLEGRARDTLAPAARAALSEQVALPREFRDGFGRPALSRREKQVLGLVVMGFGNAEIAAKLHVAESTVKTHLTACFVKLGVRTRSEATALILDPDGGVGLGILSLTDAGEEGRE